ncbi:MAG: hypothetical protein WCK35_27020 [Chloroflexota bacterium]
MLNIGEVEPTCFVRAVNGHRQRRYRFLVDQQNNHLALALYRTVLRAGVAWMGQAVCL